ncbi:uroplakin-1a [Protopterus annectens]|uniref:uroplakin-1a n=1 Tax=Protopterus annectens TaxID=7888 RepID=UPI001CFA5E28|nr:uroplakin-1a [Protopterus annectens]
MGDGKGSPAVVGILIFGNVIILLSGLALFSETIWVNTDERYVYPILGVSGKDDVFAGAWIAIFTGFFFFLLGIFGIFALIKGSKTMLATYLILMLIVYIFECASCITSFTHRDYMVSNDRLIMQQMLKYYTNPSPEGVQLTSLWNRLMLEQNCCGVNGPQDWVSYTSTFSSKYSEDYAPWPLQCCVRDRNYLITNQAACTIGHQSYVHTNGCFDYIRTAVNNYAWGVSWFGFAILMWTFLVMGLTMYHYTTI